jgi:hypothetical protein
VVAAAIAGNGNSWGWDGGSGSGSLTIHGGLNFYSGSYGAEISMWSPRIEIDWEKHYYDEGYSTGHGIGFTVGSDEGYGRTYPIAYANAYKVAFLDGVGAGTQDGTRAGSEEGYDAGWDKGYDGGFDAGFYAGIDFGLFGEFFEPQYAFAYTRRSDASTAQTLLALHAPEPSSFFLIGCVAGTALIWRRRS